jgi:hypothetical protein
VHDENKLHTDVFDFLETLMVVGFGTTDPDLDLMLNKKGSNFSNGTNDTLEGRGDASEVSNTTTDEENLDLKVFSSTYHKIKDSGA